MSLIPSAVKTNDSSFSLSQEIDLPDEDISATTTSGTNNFDLRDKTFPLISQNSKPCQYINVNNISLKINDMIFSHVNIRSRQKKLWWVISIYKWATIKTSEYSYQWNKAERYSRC